MPLSLKPITWAKGKIFYEEFIDHIINTMLSVNRNNMQMPLSYLMKVVYCLFLNNLILSVVTLVNTNVKVNSKD